MEKPKERELIPPRCSRPDLLRTVLTISNKLREYGFDVFYGIKGNLPFYEHGVYWLTIMNSDHGKVMPFYDEDLLQMQGQDLSQVTETLIKRLINIIGEPNDR